MGVRKTYFCDRCNRDMDDESQGAPVQVLVDGEVVAFFEDIDFRGGGFGTISVNFNSIYSGLPLFFLDNSEGDIDLLMQVFYEMLSIDYDNF